MEGEAPPEPILVNAQEVEPQISQIVRGVRISAFICAICGQYGFKFRIRAETRNQRKRSENG